VPAAASFPAPRAVQREIPVGGAGPAGGAEGGGPGVSPGGAVVRFRPLAVLHRRYVLMESDDGLVLMDPVAARERITYERLRPALGGRVEAQRLLSPVLVEVDLRDLELLHRHAAVFLDSGLEIGAFGGRTMQVTALPACVAVADPQRFVDDLLHDLREGTRGGFAPEILAKAMARRAGVEERASLPGTPRLLEELMACELPYCAPDGRPTLSEISLAEIDRRFRNG
jgi:DNA mismatch repair protein MutL